MDVNSSHIEVFLVLEEHMMKLLYTFAMFLLFVRHVNARHCAKHLIRERALNRSEAQIENLNRIIGNDISCVEQLRMDRNTFGILCSLLRSIGRLKDTRHVKVEEKVALFLHILAHHVKNRVIKFRFLRSGETVSRHFNVVLKAVLRLQEVLLHNPEPVPENSTDERWRWFKVVNILLIF